MNEVAAAPSRREYLERGFAETMRVTLQILDWRSAAVGMLIAGVGTLALLFARSPALVAVLVVAYVLAVVLWAMRRRTVEAAGYATLRQGLIPSGIPTDHEATADLPIHLLEPEDAPDLDTLDRMLRVRPTDMAALRTATRRASIGLLVLSLFGSASTLLLIVAVFVVMTVGFGEGSPVHPVLYFALLVFALAPGQLIAASVARYGSFVRSGVGAQVLRAEPLLQRLGATDEPYVRGEVIKWTGDRYVIDRKRLRISPDEPWFAVASRKTMPWIMWSAAVIVLLSAGLVSLYLFAGIL